MKLAINSSVCAADMTEEAGLLELTEYETKLVGGGEIYDEYPLPKR